MIYHVAPIRLHLLMNDYRFVRCPACGSLAWKGTAACPCCGQPIPQRFCWMKHHTTAKNLPHKLPPHPIVRVNFFHYAISGPDFIPLIVPQKDPTVQIPHVREP